MHLEPYAWSLTQTRQALSERTISAEELVSQMLARIEQYNPSLRAFLAVSELALESARAEDTKLAAGAAVGPLSGIPVAVKDLFDTDFLPTTYGTVDIRPDVPQTTAQAVLRLQGAGAIVIGKTNLHEFAYGTTSENPHYGSVVNPWNRSKITGGSSGGSSAAIAAGLCTAALGTDTGGSVRIPASLTGHVGLKPSYGRIPTTGVYPLATSLDHVGPMTRTVADAALLFAVLCTPAGQALTSCTKSSSDPSSAGRPIRVGVPKRFFYDKCHPSVHQTVLDALRKVEQAYPQMVFEEVEVPGIDEVPDAQNAILASEARAVHEERLLTKPGSYGEDVRKRLEAGDTIRGWQYVRAQQQRNEFRSAATMLLHRVDVLVTPTTPLTATDIGQAKAHIRTLEVGVRSHLTRFTSPWNLSGLPALTLPCGLSPDGMPVGLQLVAAPNHDEQLLRIASRFEEVLQWHSVAPEFR